MYAFASASAWSAYISVATLSLLIFIGTVDINSVADNVKRWAPSTVIITVPVPKSAISTCESPSVIAFVEIVEIVLSTYALFTPSVALVGDPTLII